MAGERKKPPNKRLTSSISGRIVTDMSVVRASADTMSARLVAAVEHRHMKPMKMKNWLGVS